MSVSQRLTPVCAVSFVLAVVAGCALRPAGEREQRRALEAAAAAWEAPTPPALPEKPTADDYLQHAFYANAELRARYWQWYAAVEQIPQDASWPGIAVQFSYMFSKENMKRWDRTTLAMSNDPMSGVPLPSKLAAAGRRALEEARAAAARFEKAKFILQGKVLSEYYGLALLAESIRIRAQDAALLKVVVELAATRVKAGTATQADLLAAQTELDLARNDLETLRARVPALAARLNALVGRPAAAPVPLPEALPEPRPLPVSDDAVIRFGSERSSELAALAHEVAGSQEALHIARQRYLPDFGLMASITGNVEKMLGVMLMLPTQLEAIKAGIAQARANLYAAEAARVQYERDLAASFTLNLYILRNNERQMELLEKTILPRAEQAAAVAQTAYANNKLTFGEMLGFVRTLLDVRLVIAELRTGREKALADIETWTAMDAEVMPPGGAGMRAAGAMRSSGGTRGGM